MGWDMLEATRRWLAGQQTSKRDGRGQLPPRTMAPWDENAYFQAIQETFFTGVAGTHQLAQADPMRVALIFSLNTGATALITTQPGNVTFAGILLNSTQSTLVITQRDFGNLCQSDWWTALGPGINITVIEVRLREWPQ
jgi:hypothetical protein